MSSQPSPPGGQDESSRLVRSSRRGRAAARRAIRQTILAGLVRDGRVLACTAHRACVEQVVRRLQSDERPRVPRELMITFWSALMCRDCERLFNRASRSPHDPAASGMTGGVIAAASTFASTSASAASSEPRRALRPSDEAALLAGGWLRRDSQLWLGDPQGADASEHARAGRAAMYLVRPPAPSDADGHDEEEDAHEREARAARPFALFSEVGEAFERGRRSSVRRVELAAHAACRMTLPVDEWLCVVLQGVLDVTVAGARTLRLNAAHDGPQLLWLPALPSVAAGLPAIALQAVDGPVRGMAMLYRAGGVDLTEAAGAGRRSEATTAWTPERVAEYWHAASERYPQLRDGAPFVTTLERLALADRPAIFESRALFERSSAFEIALSSFPAISGPRVAGDMTLTQQEGWREMVIPLTGRLRYALAPVDWSDFESSDAGNGEARRLSELAQIGRPLDLGSLASVAMRSGGLPDLLVFDTALFHGFSPAGRDGASLLRLRGPD